MMNTQANKYFEGIGGHISTYASASHAWEMGFNHFFRGKDGEGSGDHLYWQGHASRGLRSSVARGRLTHGTLRNSPSWWPRPFQLSSPSFDARILGVPTVSMGLGAADRHPPNSIQPIFGGRGLTTTRDSRVWYTAGDGESDEPESLSQLSLAGREGLDNIVMTMNCNLQHLDGHVRGNSKIVQELEGRYQGAG